MNTKVIKILEFDKITNLLSEYATSNPGKELCLKLLPSSDINKVKKYSLQTEDALYRIVKNGEPNFAGITDINKTIDRLEASSSLTCSEILLIKTILEISQNAIKYSRDSIDKEKSDSISKLFKSISNLELITKHISKCIIAEDEYYDDATPNLSSIRRKYKNTENKIHEVLTQMVNSTYSEYLQDNIITMRDNRYCISVKPEYKNKIKGIVCDTSSSGSTIFIEPLSIIELDNELTNLKILEEEEIKNILSEISQMCLEKSIDIRNNFELLKLLDFIFAKAKYALKINAKKPKLNNNNVVELKSAIHPLLDQQTAVPINIKLDNNNSMLIITGPNTGGKTVSLKTVGLLCLMNQSGLLIPASSNSSLCLFNEIYADIGDEQSIEKSLSTFSSHMINLVDIITKTNNNSLCLLDELCSGTDPKQGAYLAISILNKIKSKNSLVMATTHYSELKAYALNTPGVVNAACEFDTTTLKPTYKLITGIPGKSYAFDIASKLGLEKEIIDNAISSIDKGELAIEDLLKHLESKRKEIELKESRINKNLEETTIKLQETTKINEELKSKKSKLIEDARLQANEILVNAKKTADEIIKSMRKSGININSLESSRNKLNNKIKDNINHTSNNIVKISNKKSDFHIGDRVKIISLDSEGSVISLPNDKGEIGIQMGILKTTANINSVKIIGDDNTSIQIQKHYKGKTSINKSINISTEINLIGKTSDEAIMLLDKYIDDAFLAKLPEIRIVHGKGSGILRNKIQTYLKSNKHISMYRLGEFGEGDSGVTIATLNI